MEMGLGMDEFRMSDLSKRIDGVERENRYNYAWISGAKKDLEYLEEKVKMHGEMIANHQSYIDQQKGSMKVVVLISSVVGSFVAAVIIAVFKLIIVKG